MKKTVALLLLGIPFMAYADLSGTNWLLSELGNRKLMLQSPISLNFENNKFNGKDGCNYYHGSYQVKGNQFSVNKNIASTMMACPDPLERQAAVYFKALTAATQYKIQNEQLLLMAKGQTVAKFYQQRTGLNSTSWQVISSNNGKQAVVSTMIGTTLTMQFSDKHISGSAGCNQYSANYQVSGNQLSISDIAITKMFCAEPQGLMEQENQFLSALKTVKTFEFDGVNLRLRTETGATAVVLGKP